MNATVITTGPGVIIETATASMNWRSVSQWNCWTTPPYRNGTIASPLPNTNSPAPAKYARIFHSTPTDAGPPRRPVASPGAPGRSASAGVAGAVCRHRSTIGTSPHNEEDPDDLRLGPGRYERARGEETPEELIPAQRHPHEFQHAAGDDGNDGGADPVEQPLNPRQPAETDVQLGEDEHHEKRRADERERDQRRAELAGVHPTEVHRQLRREGPWGELGKGEALLVLLGTDPSALLYEVLLHVPGERDRPAEPQGAEPQEVEQERPQARSLHCTLPDGPCVQPIAA